VDPNVRNEQRGLPEDGKRDNGSGTSYLRQLRMRTAEALGVPLQTTATTLPAPLMRERRATPRYEYTGSVEVRPEDSGVRLWGALKDISLNGCYVEMTTTFPVNTKMYIALEAGGIRVVGEAMVRASYPSLGMGMSFTVLAPTQRLRLKEILAVAAEKRASERRSG
jgi:hypothetical protein